MSFCPSTYVRSRHPNQASHEPAMSQPITRKNLLTRPYFFAKFLVFRIMSAFCRKFSQYIFFAKSLHFLFQENFAFFAKQIEAKFYKKAKVFIFPEQNAKMRNFQGTNFFSRNGFPFLLFFAIICTSVLTQ